MLQAENGREFELRVEKAGSRGGVVGGAEVIGRAASAASRGPVGSLGLFLALSVEALMRCEAI